MSQRVSGVLTRPVVVLGALVLVQWAALVTFVRTVPHNGWLFYQGGDQTFFYTVSWVLSGGHIPRSEIGYGWSYLLSPIARAFGPNLLTALPAVVLVQVLVLLPLALYCVYAIAANIGGRRLGYLAAAGWVVVPFALIPLWDSGYHAKYVEQFLPQALGLSGLGDFPSMICLLVAALFCLRSLDSHAPLDAVLAGCAAGFAIGIKPSNVLFLAGPVLAFAVARRFGAVVGFALGLLPFLFLLALWKYRGLAHLPIFTPDAQAFGAGGGLAAAFWQAPVAEIEVHRYVEVDWSQLRQNYIDLRTVLRGLPLLQALPLLGFIAATRRSWPKALLLGGWLGAFIVVKGSSVEATVDSGALLRLFMPALPPVLILSALIPVLVLGSRPGWVPLRSTRLVRRRHAAVAIVAFWLVPMLLVLVLPPLRSATVAKSFPGGVMVPIERSFTVDVRPGDDGVLVSWQAPSSPGTHAFYRVFRSRPIVPAVDPDLSPGRDGIHCHERPSGYAGAADCALEMSLVGVTRARSFVDRPPPGAWVYRVGLAANWLDDIGRGDVLLLSGPGVLPAET